MFTAHFYQRRLSAASAGFNRQSPLLGVLILALLLTALSAAQVGAAQVTFEYEDPSAAYGADESHVQGEVVLTEDGIAMSVEDFYSSGVPYFGNAYIVPASSYVGAGQSLQVANIGLRFDFTGTPDAPNDAGFVYHETGGSVNLRVNDQTVHEAANFSDLDGVTVAPGVVCSVSWTALPYYNEYGSVTLTGAVQSVQIGGQELIIDNVHIAEDGGGGGGDDNDGESGCHDCDHEVTHETQPVGRSWGAPHGDAPGDLAFVEEGIPVRLRRYRDGLGGDFNECTIQWTASGFGQDNFMHFSRIDVSYEIHELGEPVEIVFFLFASMGSLENIRVNSGPMHIGDIESAPTNIAPGITYLPLNVIPLPGGGVTGMGVLIGNVQRLVLGGEDFYADEICVMVDEDGYECDLLVDVESQIPGTTWGILEGDAVGDVIFTESDIPVALAEITYSDGSTNFDQAGVDPAVPVCLDNNTLRLENIGATFTIGAAGVTPLAVMFDYWDAGGYHNLQVNGADLYVGDLAAAPTNIAPGVTLSVITTGYGYDVCGRVILVGNVQHLLVAGQEFAVDNLCVIAPEGDGAAACDHEVRFEDETLGTTYGYYDGDSEGDYIFSEDLIDVSVEEFFDGSSWVFWSCGIAEAAPSTGVTSGQALSFGAISVEFDFSGLGQPVAEVYFEFVDWAGIENIRVNDNPFFYYGQIVDFPAEVAPGVDYEVTWWPIASGEAAGRVVLTGNVQRLRIGGQQFMLDNICVVLEGGTTPVAPQPKIQLMLDEPFPNPCNPSTTLSFSLPRSSPVRLAIYNLAGRRVATLVDGEREAGNHSVIWRGKDDSGGLVPSGMYFARLEAAGTVESRKVLLLK